ncbi:MAG: A/G-specific adenine glycosylase [Luteolibacter sp.]
MAVLKPRFEVAAADAPDDFRKALGEWFSEKGKDYPWRRTREPYPVLVSEMMLQQTRLATVLGKGYYTRFLEKFPDVRSLAEADDESLLKAWEGLGYYRRARMLRETGRAVLRDHGGEFPSDEAALLALPGIGPYTAAALLSFAFGKVSALVDGNVSRVLARLTDDFSLIDSTATVKEHRKLAAALCDPADPRRHHYAMMELGQTVCSVGVPHCESCPVTRFCKSSSPEVLPMKKARAKITRTAEHAVWIRDEDGRVLLHREAGKRRTGLWKLPLRLEAQCEGLKVIYENSYAITRYKVLLKVYGGNTGSEPESGDEWVEVERLGELPLAAPFRRAVERLLVDF